MTQSKEKKKNPPIADKPRHSPKGGSHMEEITCRFLFPKESVPDFKKTGRSPEVLGYTRTQLQEMLGYKTKTSLSREIDRGSFDPNDMRSIYEFWKYRITLNTFHRHHK